MVWTLIPLWVEAFTQMESIEDDPMTEKAHPSAGRCCHRPRLKSLLHSVPYAK